MKEPTAVKSLSRLFPNFAHSWKQIFNTIYQTTADNKLREFGFKFLHRILVTNRELKRFKIRNDDICAQCKNFDSLEHTFLECPINVKFYQEISSWFNAINKTFINLSNKQFLFQNYPSPSINGNLRHQLDLLWSFSGPSIWNNLDEELKSFSLRSFKQTMNKHYLSTYG